MLHCTAAQKAVTGAIFLRLYAAHFDCTPARFAQVIGVLYAVAIITANEPRWCELAVQHGSLAGSN